MGGTLGINALELPLEVGNLRLSLLLVYLIICKKW